MRLSLAIILATLVHSKQKDKVGLPYIYHPLRVMLMVQTAAKGLPENKVEPYLIAAILHDTIEDTWVRLWMIHLLFGRKIAVAVEHLTRRVYPETRRPIETHVESVFRAKQNPIAHAVKTADAMDNLGRCANLPPEERGLARRYVKALRILDPEEFGYNPYTPGKAKAENVI